MKTTLIYYDSQNRKCYQEFCDPELAEWLKNYLIINAPESRPEIVTI